MTNTKPYKKLWAIMSVDKSDNEGICMVNLPNVGPQLAITGEKLNLEHFLAAIKTMQARQEAHNAGLKIVVAEFNRGLTRGIDEQF